MSNKPKLIQDTVLDLGGGGEPVADLHSKIYNYTSLGH